MADAALAGLPRLVRVVEEVRARGIAAVGIGVAAAGWWLAAWLVGQDVDGPRTLLGGLVVAVPTLLLAGLAGRRRLAAVDRLRPPPRPVVYETAADGRERRVRLAGIVVFGVIVLIMFDRLRGDGGEMAGLVAGLFLSAGFVDVMEARAWERIVRDRRADLYLLIRPHALMAHMGPGDVYERPHGDREEREIPSPYDL